MISALVALRRNHEATDFCGVPQAQARPKVGTEIWQNDPPITFHLHTIKKAHEPLA